MANSKKTSREYGKPDKFFPLSPHKRGWCKKINDKVKVVCGHLPPDQALAIYRRDYVKLHGEPVIEQKPEPIIPATPLVSGVESLTTKQLWEKYHAHKIRNMKHGSYSPRSLQSVREAMPKFIAACPGSVTDLKPMDFADFRAGLEAKYAPNSLNRHVMIIRAMFNWGYRNGMISSLPQWGDSFLKASALQSRKYRNKVRAKYGPKLFTPEEIKRLLSLASPRMKAMIYLGVNGAMGNTDMAELTMGLLNFKAGIIESYPRQKTEIDRRIPLWPETITALQDYLSVRPKPAESRDRDRVFLTQEGHPLLRADGTRRVDYCALWMTDLLKKANLSRRGTAFYALRHTAITAACGSTDLHATARITGHALPGGMLANYVQQIDDGRLRKVTDHIRQQILG